MSDALHSTVTLLLERASEGDSEALDRALPLVYGEMRAAAERALRGERRDHTLGATALVHEAYLRLAGQTRVRWCARGQFLAVGAQIMRRVLVDHARARAAAKRGGGGGRLELSDSVAAAEEPGVDVVLLHEALERLGELDPQQASVVEMRFFGGLSVEETGAALSISPATVKREWAMAKAWLRREIDRAA